MLWPNLQISKYCVIFTVMKTVVDEQDTGLMGQLLSEHEEMLDIPKVGEIISGTVLDKARNAIYVDLGHLGVGVIYGRDLFDDVDSMVSTDIGSVIEATVERFDNEDNLVELSLQSANHERSWSELRRRLESGEIFDTEILEANKGGLIMRVSGVTGFLPVSQLAPDHYPRVEGGDKNKIFDRLKDLVGEKFSVKVIGAEQETEKLILSEKAAVSDEMSEVLKSIAVGDVVKGTVSGLVDFGAFLKFLVDDKELEGLVHISELAWQRIDNVDDVITVGDEVEAKVIGVDGLRISLSIKQLQDDPWMGVKGKYKIGDKVTGEILKVTAFGGFIKLDNDIHGLVHVSELPDEAQSDPATVLDAGEKQEFTIISLEPTQHRLGLSLRSDKDRKTDLSKKEDKSAGKERKTGVDESSDDKDEKDETSEVRTKSPMSRKK